MKNIYLLLTLLVLGCGQKFDVSSQNSTLTKEPAMVQPEEPEKTDLQKLNELKEVSLVKEINFNDQSFLKNGANAQNGICSLTNPNNENQYVDTETSVKNLSESTISLWFKTENPTKIQHLLWEGVSTENGWGGGADNIAKSEFNLSLNHWNDLRGFVISTFLGYNESSVSPNPLAVMFPVTRNTTSGLFETTGSTTTLDTNWHQINVSIKKTENLVSIKTYIDGNLLEEGSGTQTNISNWNSNLYIGKSGVNGFRNFNGQVKNFLLFNKNLTNEEISLIYSVQKN